MRPVIRMAAVAVLVAGGLAVAQPAAASPIKDVVTTFDYTDNMHPMGYSERTGTINSDLAFWGNLAVQGNYVGFRLIDISSPANPVELLDYDQCQGNQGDIVIWENILVRSWNSPAPAGLTCDGQPVPTGWEGVHVFDISNRADPQLLTAVSLPCGSHTATLVPDLANNRLIIYSNVSSGCVKNGVTLGNAIDIIAVPLSNPAAASRIGEVPIRTGSLPTNNGCHDAGVILGDENLLACASGHAANVFSIGAPRGGTLTNPRFLYSIEEQEVMPDGEVIKIGAPIPGGGGEHHAGRWHSAAFTWDGEVLVLGWEPGGGVQAECTEHDPAIMKSAFFYDADTGAKLGQWTLPRDQTDSENCTIHNYNVVPLRDRYVLVSGNYQSGISVVDFTDPAAAVEVAYADPAPLHPTTLITGGDWSTYWYNGWIYESDITRGLLVWNLSSRVVAGAKKLPFLNPQTNMFTIG